MKVKRPGGLANRSEEIQEPEEIVFESRLIWVDEGLYDDPNMAERLGEHKLRLLPQSTLMFSDPDKVAALMEFCESQVGITTIEVPEIIVEDGKEALVFTGQTIPSIKSYKIDDKTGKDEPIIEQKEIGVRIKLSGHIIDDPRSVFVEMQADYSEVFETKTDVDERGNMLAEPQVRTSSLATSVTVSQEYSVLLGGQKVGDRYLYWLLSVR